MSQAHPITGAYKITHMDQWDQDFVDIEVPGFIRFDPHGQVEFHFGYVTGEMTVVFTDRNGKPAAEWTWEGNDEMDPASGRGWAVLQDDGRLEGELSFLEGDSSAFTAERTARGGKKAK
ncbi:MAG: hypothetical protein ACHRHE_03135 [Tepidisphaerales bacterium]